jgi:hypothetical protein
LNFSQNFYPFSVGWDSANHYLLTIKLLIENGDLRTGIFPAFIEIVLGIFGKIFGLTGVQFLIIFWGSLLPITFYMVGKRFKINNLLNILLAISLFFIPAIQFQFSNDVKLDIIYLQLLLVILAYFQTKRSLLLLGFAPLAKLTAFWLFPVAIFSQFIDFTKKKIKIVFISIIILFLPISIFCISNLLEYGQLPSNLYQWQEILLKGKNNQPKVDFTPILSAKLDWVASINAIKNTKKSKYTSTSFKEEVSRYSGFETNFFKKIWAIFTSPNIPFVNKQYVDLGFLWILFLPILIFSLYLSFKQKKEIFLLSSLAISFFLPWIFITEGIAWYGGPFLILLYLIGEVILY